MEDSPIIRFRIDKDIARRAHRMAKARGMELPDALRMMLTRAVQLRDFSIDLADHMQFPTGREPVAPFEPRYWGPYKATIDAELALALLRRTLADASGRQDEARQTDPQDLHKQDREQLSRERREALRLPAEFDCSDTNAIANVLEQITKTEASAPATDSGTGSPIQSARRKSMAERDRFMAQCCIPDLTDGASPSVQPAAMLVMGQPGSGVSVASALLGRAMRHSAGDAVALSMERIRAYDNGLSAASAQRWLRRAVDAARERRLNLIIEDELDDPPRMGRFVDRLRQDGYVVQVVCMCTSPQISRLLRAARYALWQQHGLAPKFVTAAQHDEALVILRATLNDFEEGGSVDGLRVIGRDGRQLFENRMAGSDWLRAPRAAAVWDKELSRALSDKDAVQLAMCWETLSRALVHDPRVPRDVASEVLDDRNRFVEQCEASPSRARMLQWACEGAAFREMDRFAFEAAFPHHARAAAMMGQALIEAEKLDAAESERFLHRARENIAQRIERGDMARIAARAAMSTKAKRA